MDLIRLFTNKEIIAGLEISDTALRLVLLDNQKKEKEGAQIKLKLEERLAAGDVVGGTVKNQSGFIKSAKNLLARAKTPVKYVIVSLPDDCVYAKIFSFPPNIKGEKLNEAIKLITDFQLPKKPEEIFFDWQIIDGEEKNEVLLSSAGRKNVNELISLLEKAGLQIVAIEYHSLSAARAIKTNAEPVLLVKKGETSTAFSIIKNGLVRFSRIVPQQFFSADYLAEEMKKIIGFYENEDQPPERLILIGEFSGEELKKMPLKPSSPEPTEPLGKSETASAPDWLAAFGAARRGLVPRAEDKFISLMAVGTEKAYEQKRALTFADFLTGLTVVLSLFFVSVFAATWLLMLKLQQNFNQQIESYNSRPGNSEALELEAKAKNFNGLVGQTANLIRTEPHWSSFLSELNSAVTGGITINNLTIAAPGQPLTLLGVAAGRNQLNLFKKSLEQSPLLKNIRLPLENLDKRSNIPFSISFELKDGQILYQ